LKHDIVFNGLLIDSGNIKISVHIYYKVSVNNKQIYHDDGFCSNEKLFICITIS